jgi:hypothetical protein
LLLAVAVAVLEVPEDTVAAVALVVYLQGLLP